MPVNVPFLNRERMARNAAAGLKADDENWEREWDGLAYVDDTICKKMGITPHDRYAPYHDAACFWVMARCCDHSTHTMDAVPRDADLEISLGERLIGLGPIFEKETIIIEAQELGAWILDTWEIQAYR